MLDDPFDHFGIDWTGETDFDPPAIRTAPPPTGPGVTDIRSRLHAVCALYRHAGELDQRLALVETLEQMTIQLAYVFALDLIEAGWRPDETFVRDDALADLAMLDRRVAEVRI